MVNMTEVELVTKTQGVGIYDSLSQGEIVEAVARHGKIKDYGKLIAYLIKHKHWSPLEHVHFTFRIKTARDISAQMMRHRSFHWQELSQRYDRIQKCMPIELRKQGETNRQVGDTIIYDDVMKGINPNARVKQAIDLSFVIYDELINKYGVARECARRILPMCAETVVHMTGNLRDFLAYINVRCEKGTQKEHREIAVGIGEALEKEFPTIWDELGAWKKGGFM